MVLDMNRCVAVKSGATRRVARRSYADAARLKGMTAAQDRATFPQSTATGIGPAPGGKVRVAAQREIRSEEGAHSLDRYRRR